MATDYGVSVDNMWTLSDSNFLSEREESELYVDDNKFIINNKEFDIYDARNIEGCLQLNEDFKLLIPDHYVEDFCIIYIFRYNDFYVLRCYAELDYSSKYYLTLVFDIKNGRFVDAFSKDLPCINNQFETSEEYLVAKFIYPEFNEFLNIDYTLEEDI